MMRLRGCCWQHGLTDAWVGLVLVFGVMAVLLATYRYQMNQQLSHIQREVKKWQVRAQKQQQIQTDWQQRQHLWHQINAWLRQPGKTDQTLVCVASPGTVGLLIRRIMLGSMPASSVVLVSSRLFHGVTHHARQSLSLTFIIVPERVFGLLYRLRQLLPGVHIQQWQLQRSEQVMRYRLRLTVLVKLCHARRA